MTRSISRQIRLKKAISNLALSAGVVILLLVTSEIVARIYYYPENLGTAFQFDQTLGWSLKPNTTLRAVDFRSGIDYRIRINSLGLRDREVPPLKNNGRKRILLLGDSITFGTGVDERWRYSDFLRRALRGSNEVVNTGVAGWGNDQELLYFESRGWRLQPDVVIIQLTVANDVLDNMLDHLYMTRTPKPVFVLDGDSLVLTNTDFEAPVVPRRARLRDFLKKSRLLLFVKRRLDRVKYGRLVKESVARLPRGLTRRSLEQNYSYWSVYQKDYDPRFEDAWQVTLAILRRLADRCQLMGADLIVFAAPLRIEVDDGWREEMIRRSGINAEHLDMRKPYDRLAAFCKKHDIAFLYPLQEFRNGLNQRDLYLKEDYHPNRYGHALAARVLAEELTRRYNMRFDFAHGELDVFETLR